MHGLFSFLRSLDATNERGDTAMHAPFLGLKVNSFLLRLQQKNEGKGQGQVRHLDS